jgi:replicative superfamily II helicase
MRGNSQLLMTYDYDEAYMIGEIALLNRVASDHRARAVVLCPNPHQAEKRFRSLSQKCHRLGIEASEMIRRRAATREDAGSGRVVVATYTSLDIASRVNPDILDGVVYVLVDRLDLIGQPGIGARLETALVTFLSQGDIQYAAICPPLEDKEELGKWLSAEIVEDPKVDVKMIFSVMTFEDSDDSLTDQTQFVTYRQGQVMILASNIATCEELALQLADIETGSKTSALDLRLSPEHRDDLRLLSLDIKEKYPQCETTVNLSQAISKGVAFIHEGVGTIQRRALSEAWEDGLIPVIVMPTRFAIASGLRATVVFLMGVFMQEFGEEVSQEDAVTILSEWQLSDVLEAAGRRGVDNEAFGIVVVDNESERVRVIAKYFEEDSEGNLKPRLGEVDSVMDEIENVQDLVLRQLCGKSKGGEDPFSVIDRTFWGSSSLVTDIRQAESQDETSVENLLTLRSTRSTFSRAKDIPDKSVKLTSIRPDKIEGLVHSGSREIWHYTTLRAKEGVSCSCESWKYQGIRKHRLCKHLVKFARYTLNEEDTKPYAAGVIMQALRGLEVFDELEADRLIVRDKDSTRCTELGEDVAVLGVPVKDAKRVMRAIADAKSDLKTILRNVVLTRTTIPKEVVKRVLSKLPAKNIEDIICEDDMPGIVENCLEELEYVNSILLKLLDTKHSARKESKKLEKSLHMLLESMK